MSTETISTTEEVLNEIIEILIPELNKAIPGMITDMGLDPWEKVTDGSATLGKINLGICTAKVKAEYKIRNMTGLSSLQVISGEVTSLNPVTDGHAAGTMKLDLELEDKLKADLKGSLEASCGGLKEDVSLSGTAKATGVTGKVELDIDVEVGSSVCLTKASITKLSLDYKDIDIDVDGLGIFNDFLDPLVDLLNDVFGDTIKDLVANMITPPLNGLIQDELPVCL